MSKNLLPENFASWAESDKQEWIQLELAEVYQLGKQSKIFFAEYFLPHLLKLKTPEFHEEIYEILSTELRVALAAPRSFAKSTAVNVVNGLHLLLYGDHNQKVDILLISNSGALSDEWVRKVKTELEANELLRAVFGDQKSDKWTQDHIILKNGNQLRAKGYGYQVRGFRPTHIFCDDLEDDELVRSKDRRDKMADWFFGALLNTLEPHQQFVIIGTLLHPLSLLKRIILEDDPQFGSWTKKIYAAIAQNAQQQAVSIWPEKWSIEQLEARKAEIGPHKFEAEYMNNPVADSTVIFHPDYYRYYEAIPDDEKVEMTVTGFDLIGSTSEFEKKAYVAFVTIAKTDAKRIYLLDARRGRWSKEDVVDQFIDVYLTFHPDVMAGEKVNFMQIVNEYLTEKARERDIYLPIQGIDLGTYTDDDPLRKSKDKVSRALSVQHIFSQKLFHQKRDNGRIVFRDFYEELSTFPASDYADQVDAMVHALHMIIGRIKLEVSGGTSNPFNLPSPMTNMPPGKRLLKKLLDDSS